MKKRKLLASTRQQKKQPEDWDFISASGLFPASNLVGGVEKNPKRPDPIQVETAERWIQVYTTRLTASTKTNTAMSSYGLKHVAETWGKKNGLSPYISNGAFILAMQRMCYSVMRVSPGSPNAFFNAIYYAEEEGDEGRTP